ncbi:MAG: oxaloacetate decarboxylase [Lachnospiraceae bacterium]|nr:oxaloacetate decarboxylase [Lachnospiraceae bacterium]
MKKYMAVIIMGIMGILLTIAGVVSKAKKAVAISIIGGADGPTSVFLAGKVGTGASVSLIIVGVILIAITIILWMRKRGK